MIIDYRKKTGLEKAPEASYLPKGRDCYPLRAMLGNSSGEVIFLRGERGKVHHAPGCDMEHLSLPKVLSGCKGDLR
ncbi:hypothetical protein DRJ00_02895 [Candidatus Aerophobetes bacterium]|uniref:Uncharacterized protein n=1 Tax=Aerophobetes bacterium TaxID=2030807 RepID=A0A497E6L8_UNCAE|nr:MAG: hypothetical protein DRJ00_02895 [Candidatus Aerophobetes bacterium]